MSIDLAMVALTAVMVAVVGAGVAHHRRRLALGVVGALAAWLALTAALAASGALAVASGPPRIMLLPVTFLAVMIAASRTAAMRALLATTPRAWPIAAQSYRIAVELVLYALYLADRAPQRMTFEGRNLDILVGVSAPIVAWLVARRGAITLAIAWNLAALAILANTIATAVTSLPGPLHLAGAEPFPALTTWPVVWLPAFLAPLAIALHVVSLRQAFAARRTAAPLAA